MEFRNKNGLILGLSSSSSKLCEVLTRWGSKFQILGFGSDKKKLSNFKKNNPNFTSCTSSKFDSSEISNFDYVIRDGSNEYYEDFLAEASRQGIPSFNILEIVSLKTDIPIIAITGTNGKSTVAKLVELMLSKSGKRIFLGGEGFEPYINLVEKKEKCDFAVLEIDSATLEEVNLFHPKVAILHSLVPAHFETYGSLSKYFNAKAKIFSNQNEEDILIYNAENKYIVDLSLRAKSHPFPFYAKNPRIYSKNITECTYYESGQISYCLPGNSPEIYSTRQMKIRGMHNAENIMCALSAVRYLGGDPRAVQEVINTFEGLPHRMQKCLEKDGITYYDDSRSSNPAATSWGLMTFEKPVILIAGGFDRGTNYRNMASTIKKKVKLLILMGQARRAMFSCLKDTTDIFLVETLKEAVQLARSKSQKGDTIVFSPAALPEPHPSQSVEERGQEFLKILKEGAG